MANEGRVNVSLQIRNTTTGLDYRSSPNAKAFDVSGSFGPSPGAIHVTPEGVDVDLSVFTEAGMCWLVNLDPTNYVEWGVWDADTLMFYPVGILRPGKPSLFELSPNFGIQHYDTGTGTTPSDTNNTLRFIAHNANCDVRVDIFET